MVFAGMRDAGENLLDQVTGRQHAGSIAAPQGVEIEAADEIHVRS